MGGGSPLPSLTPEELWLQAVQSMRGFTSSPSGASRIDPKGIGYRLGKGYETFAAIQVIDKNGNQVLTAVGAYLGGGATHGEIQAIGALRKQLPSPIRGGRMMVVVETDPCAGCTSSLEAYARELELAKVEVNVPTRESVRGGGEVRPKTATTTSTKGNVPRLRFKTTITELTNRATASSRPDEISRATTARIEPEASSTAARTHVGSNLRPAATTIGAVGLRAVRLVRVGFVFAAVLVVPLTPGQLLFDLIVLGFSLWLTAYEKSKQEKLMRQALETLAPEIDRHIRHNADAAVATMINDWYNQGYGFLYIRLRIVLHHDVFAGTSGIAAVPYAIKDTWSAAFTDLEFVSDRSAQSIKQRTKSQLKEGDNRISYDLTWTIDEPLYTPFEYLIGEIATIEELLRAGRRAALTGPRPAAKELGKKPQNRFSEVHYKGAILLLKSKHELLARHRDVEKAHTGGAGVFEAATERKKLLHGALLNWNELLRMVKGTFPQEDGAGAQEIGRFFAEALGVTIQLELDIMRAKSFSVGRFKYRTDPYGNFLDVLQRVD